MATGKRGRPSNEERAARDAADAIDRGDAGIEGGIVSPENAAVIDPSSGYGNVDTESGGNGDGPGNGDSGYTGKRRGRKPGSGKTKKRAVASVSLAGPIYGIHLALSSLMKIEEVALDEKEAESLGEALTTLAAEYDVQPDSKVVAWIGLASVTSMIYGPRILAYRLRLQLERQNTSIENGGI